MSHQSVSIAEPRDDAIDGTMTMPAPGNPGVPKPKKEKKEKTSKQKLEQAWTHHQASNYMSTVYLFWGWLIIAYNF